MALPSRARKLAVALLILPMLLGCGCCEGPAVVFDEVFGGDRHTFTDQDVVGDWSSDCNGTVSIRADGTATVKGLAVSKDYNDAGELEKATTSGEYRWTIVPASEDNDQEVRFTTAGPGEQAFSVHAQREWGGFEDLEYYLTTPDDPVWCVLSR